MTTHTLRNDTARPFAWIALALVATMVGTRFHHFGSMLHLPDASMAVFMLGGFYLRRWWAFAAMLALAFGIDWVSIAGMGNSDFCVTPAYGFLAPAYAVLWAGGLLFARSGDLTLARLPVFALTALAANALSFLISNGAFYWIGGHEANPHFAEYLDRLAQYAPRFLTVSLCWLAAAVLVHFALSRLLARGHGQRAS